MLACGSRDVLHRLLIPNDWKGDPGPLLQGCGALLLHMLHVGRSHVREQLLLLLYLQ